MLLLFYLVIFVLAISCCHLKMGEAIAWLEFEVKIKLESDSCQMLDKNSLKVKSILCDEHTEQWALFHYSV